MRCPPIPIIGALRPMTPEVTLASGTAEHLSATWGNFAECPSLRLSQELHRGGAAPVIPGEIKAVHLPHALA